MTKILMPDVPLKAVSVKGRVSRLLTVALMFSSLVACAVTPTQPSDSGAVEQKSQGAGLATAIDSYNGRDYADAIQGFEDVLGDGASSASDRRLAHLGKAMVYLGNDELWHSMENAKMSLISAGQVAAAGGGKFSAESDLLMDAVSAVIGTESKYIALQTKSGNSGAEIAQLKRERDALAQQRDDLLAEQKRLNEALEKLKQLTLGD